MGSRELKAFCALDEATLELLKMAMNELKLSARAYDRILKVARTIADLAESEKLTSEHISEAIQYRSFGPAVVGVNRYADLCGKTPWRRNTSQLRDTTLANLSPPIKFYNGRD